MAFIFKKIKTNEVLVKYGMGTSGDSAIKREGLAFIIPGLQGAKSLSLEPFSVDIDLRGALDVNNIRVNIPSTFTLAVADDDEGVKIASRRILDMDNKARNEQVIDIVLGQLRGVIAQMRIEDINADREKFEDAVSKNITTELRKLGLRLINVNITDVTDDAGVIENLGKRAAADAQAEGDISISKAEKEGTIGRETNINETTIKQAELARERTVQTAAINKETTEKEAQYAADLAEQIKDNEIRKAEANKEIQIAKINVEKERAIADSEANILKAEKQKEETLAEERVKQVVGQEIEKEKQIIIAETEAEKVIREATARAEAIRLEAEAEAEKIGKIADAKAKGFEKMASAVGKDNIVNVMLAEQAERLAEIQADALKSIEIDKITIIDSGSNEGKSGLNGFVDDFMKSAPGYQALAESAGVEVDTLFGHVKSVEDVKEENIEEVQEVE